jgi:uncharacterized membrane protein YkoI
VLKLKKSANRQSAVDSPFAVNDRPKQQQKEPIMNRVQFLKTCGAALAASASIPVAAFAKEEDEGGLDLSDCPKRVRRTIRSYAGGGEVLRVKKERIYKARVVRHGQKLEFLVGENGKLIAIEAVGKGHEEAGEKEEPRREKGKKEEDEEKESEGGEKGKDQELRNEARISKAEAEKTALARVPGGTVHSAELEREHGTLIWSFDIATPGSRDITEVNVDAIHGNIVAVSKENPAQQAAENAQEAGGE